MPKPTDLANLTVKDAARGDNVILSGAGQSYEDLSFTVGSAQPLRVQRRAVVRAERPQRRSKRVFLEWSEDDELEITIQRQGGLTLEAIGVQRRRPGPNGTRRDRGPASSSTRTSDGSIGRAPRPDISRDEGPEGEGFYYWKFDCDDLQLFIEKYEGDPFEVGISERIDSGRVRIFRA